MNGALNPIRFELVNKAPVFNVRVDAADMRFILDSGSQHMVLNRMNENGNCADVPGSIDGGKITGMMARQLSSFEWGGLRLSNQIALMADISHISKHLESTVHGLIGCAQFMNYDLLLDYGSLTVTLIDSYGEIPRDMSGAVRIPFVMSGHIPVINARIGEEMLSLGIDTGATYNILNCKYRAFMEASGLIYDVAQDDIVRFNADDSEPGACVCTVRTVTIENGVAVNSVPVDGVTVNGVTANGVALDDMRFAYHDIDIPGVRIDGLLGYELFARYKALIRYAERELLLQSYVNTP